MPDRRVRPPCTPKGASLTGYPLEHQVSVAEVDLARSAYPSGAAKPDPIDAEAAARVVLSGQRILSSPKHGPGATEAVHAVLREWFAGRHLSVVTSLWVV
jgi:hypothetical protein